MKQRNYFGMSSFLAVLWIAAGAVAGPTATRQTHFETAGMATINISWPPAPEAESAMVLRETVPSGWAVVFLPGLAPDVEAFREDGPTVSFFVPREALLRGGSLSYSLRAITEPANLPIFEGVCLVTDTSGLHSTPVTADTVTGPSTDDFAAAQPVIRGFHVTSGNQPRATFSWSGSGTAPVAIQWCPSLPIADDPTRRQTKDGWTTFATFTPPPSTSAVRALSSGAPFEFTPDVDAPAGFYRLVIGLEEEP